MTSFALPHEVHGDGAHKVFAVHGWFADRSAYAAVLPDVDRASFAYALVDLRGYGEARDATGAYTTAEAAVDLVELADRLGWERFSVIGHSMGGAVAQRLLAVAPHRLRRIVGVSPVPASGMPLAGEQQALFTGAAHRAAYRRAIIDVTTGGRRPAAWLDRMVARSLERSDAKAFRAWLDSWAGEDFSADVVGSEVPALAVAGALDPALSPEVMRQTWMSWYPRARLAVLPGAGHYAMDETPLELIRTVEDFLRADGTDGTDGTDAAREAKEAVEAVEAHEAVEVSEAVEAREGEPA
ncbi:alpha/beta fold hydrolase [Streptomyces cinerochromogenes]|uniref:alpha/beta fold hydrolase n=1 Tax=Streptomyces cinerochromogenes TaxID=66422 RepID=UPI0019A9766E|nr:alpha/beta hydrolase [Streptomyces cinerochromogenes]GGS67370.1 esterase [Streptomyces cinerochromogenes]